MKTADELLESPLAPMTLAQWLEQHPSAQVVDATGGQAAGGKWVRLNGEEGLSLRQLSDFKLAHLNATAAFLKPHARVNYGSQRVPSPRYGHPVRVHDYGQVDTSTVDAPELPEPRPRNESADDLLPHPDSDWGDASPHAQ